jgi:hypothetical protein
MGRITIQIDFDGFFRLVHELRGVLPLPLAGEGWIRQIHEKEAIQPPITFLSHFTSPASIAITSNRQGGSCL